jgi:lipopolysaccharide transport system permease protein
MGGMIASAWRYRRFIASSIHAEYRARYARSRLGAVWMVAQPLAQVAIFSFVLSDLLSARLPGVSGRHAYVIYLMAGTLCWSLFVDVVTRCLTIFIENGNLMKKIAFPRVSLPLIVIGVAVVNNAVLFAVIAVAAWVLGYPPGPQVLWLPALVVVTLALAVSVGIVLGVLNVFMRDAGQAVPVLLQVLYWLTPIVYIASILPAQYRSVLEYNPLTRLVEGYQSVLLFGRAPDWAALWPVLLVTVVLLAFALTLFRRASPEMPDVL